LRAKGYIDLITTKGLATWPCSITMDGVWNILWDYKDWLLQILIRAII